MESSAYQLRSYGFLTTIYSVFARGASGLSYYKALKMGLVIRD